MSNLHIRLWDRVEGGDQALAFLKNEGFFASFFISQTQPTHLMFLDICDFFLIGFNFLKYFLLLAKKRNKKRHLRKSRTPASSPISPSYITSFCPILCCRSENCIGRRVGRVIPGRLPASCHLTASAIQPKCPKVSGKGPFNNAAGTWGS